MESKKGSVTKSVQSKDYEILKYLTEFLTITQIAKQRKCSRTVIYRSIRRLLEKSLIKRIGRCYDVTDKGFRVLHSMRGLSSQLRLHSLAFKISIINKPRNWELRRNKIVQVRTLSKQVNLKNNSYELHSFKNLKIKTTSKSIIFYIPSIYGKNTDECFNKALELLWDTIPKIEALFKITLIKERKCNIEIISQHYAKLQDSLAKIYKLENNKLNVYDEKGNLWLIADYSFRVNELETIHDKTAKEDMDVVKDFLNDLRKNPATMTQVTGLIRDVTANQMIFAKNMQSHISAIKQLGSSVNRLTKHISKIKKENYNLKHKGQSKLGEFI